MRFVSIAAATAAAHTATREGSGRFRSDSIPSDGDRSYAHPEGDRSALLKRLGQKAFYAGKREWHNTYTSYEVCSRLFDSHEGVENHEGAAQSFVLADGSSLKLKTDGPGFQGKLSYQHPSDVSL